MLDKKEEKYETEYLDNKNSAFGEIKVFSLSFKRFLWSAMKYKWIMQATLKFLKCQQIKFFFLLLIDEKTKAKEK